MDEDFVLLKVDMRNAWSPGKQFVMSVLHFSQSCCYLGCHGAMGPILCHGTLLAGSALSLSAAR